MFKALKNYFICWWSNNIKDIHTDEDSINRIPDQFNEYVCKRCRKTYKL